MRSRAAEDRTRLGSASSQAKPTYIALLHSIGIVGGCRLVMADLRRMAEALGLKNPRTLIATGNLIFETGRTKSARLEAKLETAFAETFGRHVDIVIRDALQWRNMVAANPFAGESARDGSRVILRVSREPVGDEEAAALVKRAGDGERVRVVAGDLWVYFPIEPVRSKLIGALTTKNLGVGALRNWNTVRRLGEMVAE
jgi:uncharacterized protein (DUF1697 family)